jgi:hypothetical protein
MSTTLSRPSLAGLETYLETWGNLPTTEDRLEKRLTSTIEELRAFYDAMIPNLEAIIEYLNSIPLSGLKGEDLKLANAVLATCEIDNAVNKWHEPVADAGIDIRRVIKKNSFTDRGD